MNDDEKREQEEQDEQDDLELEDEDAEQVAGGGPRKAGENPVEY